MGKVELAIRTPTGQRPAKPQSKDGSEEIRQVRMVALSMLLYHPTSEGAPKGSVARKGSRLWFGKKVPPASAVVPEKDKEEARIGEKEKD
ncbi:hypothetical protein FRC09_014263 [Ceratobasidium sp. 395]|nr:hypothetical protein FRC09_014263 [Ceratobasidium sp. 395]